MLIVASNSVAWVIDCKFVFVFDVMLTDDVTKVIAAR
jgi:hypothetical protein